MKLFYVILIILLGSFSSVATMAEEQKIMVNAKLLYIYKDRSKPVEEVANFKIYDGNMSEAHSHKNHKLFGGYWNLELRLNKGNFTTSFWKSKGVEDGEFWNETGRDLLIEIVSDVSSLRPNSIGLPSSNDNEGSLILDILPSAIPEPLEVVELKMDNFGLDHFCFINSSVIIDEYYYLGEFTGFGQRLYVGVPGIGDVNLSLKKLNDWKVIGTYNNGTITVDMGEGHSLNVMRVGLGPSGYEKGGPFKVFGEITESEYTKEEMLNNKLKQLQRHLSGKKLDVIKDVLMKAPYLMGRGTIAGGEGTYEYVDDAIGSFFEGRECG